MWSVHTQDDETSCTGEPSITKLFKESLEKQRKQSRSLLLLSALTHENSLQVGLLLADRADPNTRNPEDVTVLHIAIAKGNSRLIHALLKAGARVDVPNPRGFTGLQAAIEYRRKDVEWTRRLQGHQHDGVIAWEKSVKGVQARLAKYRGLLHLLIAFAVEQSLNNDWALSLLDWAIF